MFLYFIFKYSNNYYVLQITVLIMLYLFIHSFNNHLVTYIYEHLRVIMLKLHIHNI